MTDHDMMLIDKSICQVTEEACHSLVVSTWTISEKKRIAAEFLCKYCLKFYTREELQESKNSCHTS